MKSLRNDREGGSTSELIPYRKRQGMGQVREMGITPGKAWIE